jgi:energy-converting hydrogenase Eha subunit E
MGRYTVDTALITFGAVSAVMSVELVMRALGW